MGNEDQKQAVSIVITLGGQLMAAALAMIALQGAFLTFALDKKECGFWFWLFVGTGFLVFVLSIIIGGKGITKLYKTGAKGNWKHEEGDREFRWQTGLCCIGLALFILAVLVTHKDKPSDLSEIRGAIVGVADSLERQNVSIQQVSSQWQSNELNAVFVKIRELQSQVLELRAQVEQMRGTYPPVITNLIQIGGVTNLVEVGPSTNIIHLPNILVTNVIALPPPSTIGGESQLGQR